MLNFYPDKTRILFFDLEYYVPPETRERVSPSGMSFSPLLPGHKVLGGAFTTYYPLQDRLERPVGIWEWDLGSEAQVVHKIFGEIKPEWRGLDSNSKLPSLMIAGIGISHSDIPALFVKMTEYQVAPQGRLYDTLFSCRQIDLSTATIGQFRFHKQYFTYPKKKSELYQKYTKLSPPEPGGSVWDLYEAKKYKAIEERAAGEVEASIEIYRRMVDTGKSTHYQLRQLKKLQRGSIA